MPSYKFILFLFITTLSLSFNAQNLGVGIGFYPTGSEAGFGLRTSKNNRFFADIRITKANINKNPISGSFINEASAVFRIVQYEKVGLHLGLGARTEWNFTSNQKHRYGCIVPFGVEAFPFPFQNAGLFFETGLYSTFASDKSVNFGLRSVAGFVFYFIKKKKYEII